MAFIDIFNFKKYITKPSDAATARIGHVNAVYDALLPSPEIYEKHIKFYSTNGVNIQYEVVYSNLPDLYRDLRISVVDIGAATGITMGNNTSPGNNALPTINFEKVSFTVSPYSDGINGYFIDSIQQVTPFIYMGLTDQGPGIGPFENPNYALWVQLKYFKEYLPTV